MKSAKLAAGARAGPLRKEPPSNEALSAPFGDIGACRRSASGPSGRHHGQGGRPAHRQGRDRAWSGHKCHPCDTSEGPADLPEFGQTPPRRDLRDCYFGLRSRETPKCFRSAFKSKTIHVRGKITEYHKPPEITSAQVFCICTSMSPIPKWN